jgi:hypothetical protein
LNLGLGTPRGTLPVAALFLAAACTTAITPTQTETPTGSPSGPAATASSAPSASLPPVAPGDWEQVQDQPSLHTTQLNQLAWTGTRFVAAGSGGTFLDSDDGRTWNLQDEAWPDAVVWAIAHGTHGLVAVGVNARGSEEQRAASWYSADGLSWDLAPDDPALHSASEGIMQMRGVTATDAGWVAVGFEEELCHLGCPRPIRAVVWRSEDGIRWTQDNTSPSLATAAMEAVTRGGPGYVAVGHSSEMPAAGVIWTSVDSQTWSRVADIPTFHPPPEADQTFGAFMHAVTIGDEGSLVAVGSVGTQSGPGSALAWWSIDGQTWTAGSGERFLNGQLFNVAATPSGFLATGPSGSASCLGGIWSSTDGRTWDCVSDDPAFAEFAAYDSAGSSALEVVVGFGPPYQMPGGAWSGTAWIRPLR